MINISILVVIHSLISQIIPKRTSKDISVEQTKLTFLLVVSPPGSFKHSALTKVVSASPFFFSFRKQTHIPIFVDILEATFPMWKVRFELTLINASISKHQFPSSMLLIQKPLSSIVLFTCLVFVISAPVSLPVLPLSFVNFFIAEVKTLSMLVAFLPVTIVVSSAIIVVIDASTFHFAVSNEAFVYLSIPMDIDSLTLKLVVLPASKIHISLRICVYPFSCSQTLCSKLSEIRSTIGIGHLNQFRETLKSHNELAFLKIISPKSFVFDGLRSIPKRHQLRQQLSIKSINKSIDRDYSLNLIKIMKPIRSQLNRFFCLPLNRFLGLRFFTWEGSVAKESVENWRISVLIFYQERGEILNEVEIEVLNSDFSCVVFLDEGRCRVHQKIFHFFTDVV